MGPRGLVPWRGVGSAPQALGENKRRGVLWTREVVALRRVPFAEQLDALARVFSNDKVLRASLDQAPLGVLSAVLLA